MMVNAWSYNFDSGTRHCFYLIWLWQQVKKDRYLQISSFVLVKLKSPERLVQSAGFFLFTEHWLDLLYCYWAFLAFHSFDLSDERAREQEHERSHLTFKAILR